MPVLVRNFTKYKVNLTAIKQQLETALEAMKNFEKEVSVALVSQPEIKKINGQYRRLAEVTDVLSFQYDEPACFGEIVIAPAVIASQARRLSKSFTDTLSNALIHGLLHLLGYDHRQAAARKKMAAMEIKLNRVINRT